MRGNDVSLKSLLFVVFIAVNSSSLSLWAGDLDISKKGSPVLFEGTNKKQKESFIYRSNLRRLILSQRPHGVSYVEAKALGVKSIPLLLEIINDPAYKAYWTNAVVALGFLEQEEVLADLIAFYERTASPTDLEALRAHLAIPFAVGSIAVRSESAVDFLLDQLESLDARNGGGDVGDFDLVQGRQDRFILALGVSGAPRAVEALDAFVKQRIYIGLDGNRRNHLLEVLGQADSVAKKISSDGRSSYFSYRPPLGNSESEYVIPDRGLPPPLLLGAKRHVQASYSDAQFDADLLSATARLFHVDAQCGNGSDVACPVTFQRNGNVGTFGTIGDGLNSITTQAQLNAVFAVSNARVKLVTALDFCSGLNPSIIGCAETPGNSMVMETGYSGSALFLHEYGHNVGRDHRDNCESNVMSSSLDDEDRIVNGQECNAFGGAGVTLPLTLRFQGNGSGSVVISPINSTCQSDCTLEVPFAAAVTLTPNPNADSITTGCVGGCSFVMDGRIDRSVRFLRRSTVASMVHHLSSQTSDLLRDGFERAATPSVSESKAQ